jgi:hypothetical protein
MEAKTMIDHEKPAAFRRMSRGEASKAEARRIVRHLLAGCPSCQAMANRVRLEQGDPSSWDYEAAFDRVQERVARALRPKRRVASNPRRLVFAHAAR